MRKQIIQTGSSYPVYIGAGLLGQAGPILTEEIPELKTCRILLVSDSNVRPLYGHAVASSLAACGCQVISYEIPAGESSKNWTLLGNLLEFLAASHMTRSDCLIALGGGVTGDLTGFAASIYMRGISYIQIPTTLLAAVDSSVGGKTAVDLQAGKNLAGTFWQPLAVLCDTDTFHTLPEAIFLDGVAESIKYGILNDSALFEEIRAGGLKKNCDTIVSQCISMKGAIVSEDEYDRGKRELLNLGHTFAHALETCSNYTISHGHAVAMGIHMAGKTALSLGLCSESCSQAITDALTVLGFSLDCPFSKEELCEAMQKDKKRRGSQLHLILPCKIGHCRIYPVPATSLLSTIEL